MNRQDGEVAEGSIEQMLIGTAGCVLAKAIFDNMMRNVNLQAEFQKAKTECAAMEPVKSAAK